MEEQPDTAEAQAPPKRWRELAYRYSQWTTDQLERGLNELHEPVALDLIRTEAERRRCPKCEKVRPGPDLRCQCGYEFPAPPAVDSTIPWKAPSTGPPEQAPSMAIRQIETNSYSSVVAGVVGIPVILLFPHLPGLIPGMIAMATHRTMESMIQGNPQYTGAGSARKRARVGLVLGGGAVGLYVLSYFVPGLSLIGL